MRSRLPSNADFAELHSIGISGLVAAVDNYDPEQAASFRGYASLRIRGAILDELRRMDSLSRKRRSAYRQLQQTIETLEQRLGRTPHDEEIAKELGMTLVEFERHRLKSRPARTFSLDTPIDEEDPGASFHDTIADECQRPGYEPIEKTELIQSVLEHLESLPERTQKILAMYYYEGMRLAEIAEVFSVTEARICQIHSGAIQKLRSSLLASA